MKAGRPSDFGEWTPQEVRDYLDGYESGDLGEIIPTRAGLCISLGVSKNTLKTWERKSQEVLDDSDNTDENDNDIASQFLSAISRLDLTQESKLVGNGLMGTYNAAITKLMMSNHGYSDKQQQEISGPDGGAIKSEEKWQVEFVNAPTESK